MEKIIICGIAVVVIVIIGVFISKKKINNL